MLGVLPCLAAVYLGATLYFLFHDELLASLMARQSDMQYAYEDKIASLRTQLDRETSRALIDRRSLDVTTRDLMARGDALMAHAGRLDALVSQGLSVAIPARPSGDKDPTALLAPLQGEGQPVESIRPIGQMAPSTELRLDRQGDALGSIGGGAERHSEVTILPSNESVVKLYDAIEDRQAATLARLREPIARSLTRLQRALMATGLPTPVAVQDVGGPFVPLSESASGFETNLSVLEDAVRQQARLTKIAERVPLRRPLEGPLDVTSTFGPRLDPFLGRPAMHTGIDLHEEVGDAVEATAGGVVTVAGSEGGYGNMVEVDHGDGLSTRYAHLSSISVALRQRIAAGAIVGRVGSTGRATGPHLHYETRINGEPVDPTRFLKAGRELFPG